MQPSPIRQLILPVVLTLVVCLLRLYLEVHGTVTARSGGALHPLGISWLAFFFGGVFGWRSGRAGGQARLRPAFLWSLLAFAALAGTVAWRFSGLDMADRSEAAFEALRTSVLVIVAVALPMMGLALAIWPRVALMLMAYGLLARGVVLALTWWAKVRHWDTHYTKFGPAGLERPLEETMTSAALAQLGFWVPFTVVGGVLAASFTGALAGALRSRRAVP